MSRKAFSLVEVVIALGIISFVVVALLGLSSSALERVKESKRDTVGLNMIQEAISEVRSLGWSDIANQVVYFDGDGLRTDSEASAFYVCTVEVSSAAVPNIAFTENYLKSVRLIMKWPVGASRQEVLSVPFTVAKYK